MTLRVLSFHDGAVIEVNRGKKDSFVHAHVRRTINKRGASPRGRSKVAARGTIFTEKEETYCVPVRLRGER